MTSSAVGRATKRIARYRLLALAALLIITVFAPPAHASSAEQEKRDGNGGAPQGAQKSAEVGASLRFYDLISPCSGDCQVTVAFGRYVETSMTTIFTEVVPPWNWTYGDINFASLTFGRKVADYGHYISLEPEVGLGKRFGDAKEVEFWGALYLRWNAFFWDAVLDTSIAVSTGVSYATRSNRLEEMRAGADSSFQHYFSPEITFALPNWPSVSMVVRMHHRSSAGTFGGAGAFQYLMGGLRKHF